MSKARDEIRLKNEGRTDATDRNRKNRAAKKLRATYGKPHPKSPEGRKAAEKAALRAKQAKADAAANLGAATGLLEE